jgi:segregation and condensation protein A
LVASDIIWFVSLQVAGHQTEGYQIHTDVYQGPLDLLLQLIERAELDITTLALAQVTDQFLLYLRTLENQDPAEVSAFLVIAARLLQIKSSALLPRPIAVEKGTDEEDLGEALARQLIQYRRFKQLSGLLAERESAGLRTYLRLFPPSIKVEEKLDLNDLTLKDLVLTAKQIFLKDQQLSDLTKVVNLPRVTIREKISLIIQALRITGKTSFHNILKNGSKFEAVIVFLAMLELIKRRVIFAEQAELFGEINLESQGDLNESIAAESEFGE